MDKDNISIYIGNKIKYFRKNNGWTQEELGKKLNTSKGRISNFERGYRTPNQDVLFEMAEVFDISIDDLFPKTNENGTKREITSIYNKLNPTRQTKVYNFAKRQLEEQNRSNLVNMNDYIEEKMSGYLSAGTGEYLSDDINEDIRIPKSIVPDADYDLILQVNGNSMGPMFEDHEYIFVKKTTEIRSGQIGVFIIDNESYLKKAYIEDNRLRLVSLNTKYDDLIFDDVNNIKVIGTVVM